MHLCGGTWKATPSPAPRLTLLTMSWPPLPSIEGHSPGVRGVKNRPAIDGWGKPAERAGAAFAPENPFRLTPTAAQRPAGHHAASETGTRSPRLASTTFWESPSLWSEGGAPRRPLVAETLVLATAARRRSF